MAALKPSSSALDLAFAVVIPSYNVVDTLAAQLDALTAQTWTQPWGIVVVDNNSTDGTRQLAERYEDRGVRVVEAYEGRGVSYARNTGVRAIRPQTVAFVDGDDVVHPGWVTAMADALTQHPITSGSLEVDTLNPPWLAGSRPMGSASGLPRFGKTGFTSGCNCGMTLAVFDDLAGFDEDFVGLEDIEFSLRATARGYAIHFVPEARIAYRYRDDLASLWRQGRFYGRGRPELKRRARELGLSAPGSVETLKSWAWLVINLPILRNRSGRFRWAWVLANRVGGIAGLIEGMRRPLRKTQRTSTSPNGE